MVRRYEEGRVTVPADYGPGDVVYLADGSRAIIIEIEQFWREPDTSEYLKRAVVRVYANEEE